VSVKDSGFQKKPIFRSEEVPETVSNETSNKDHTPTSREVPIDFNREATTPENIREATPQFEQTIQMAIPTEQTPQNLELTTTQPEPLTEETNTMKNQESIINSDENSKETIVQENLEPLQETLLRTSDVLFEQRSIQYMKENVVEERLVLENSE
jgi:hypothetical protein